MENNSNEVVEIDLKDLMFAVLHKWRPVLAVAVIMAVLLGGTDFISPLVYLFDVSLDNKDKEAKTDKIQLEKQNWKLSAKKAKLTKDQMLYLEGGVVAESLDPLSRLQRVETEAAVINLKTQDITSDTQVKINGLNFNSSGLKLVGNLRQQVATLKEQVKTYYEINKQ